jgi:hypothetical protein
MFIIEYFVSSIVFDWICIRSTPSKAPVAASSAAAAPSPVNDGEDGFFRLQRDLISVMDKLKLCREMLLVSPGIEQDEILADVLGFVEACRDRMADVIEAGTQGLLGEELFSQCLKVNDAILRTLESERVSDLPPPTSVTCGLDDAR